jgi:hypothetical protein
VPPPSAKPLTAAIVGLLMWWETYPAKPHAARRGSAGEMSSPRDRLEVRAGAEGLIPGAGQDEGPDAEVLFGFLERVAEAEGDG